MFSTKMDDTNPTGRFYNITIRMFTLLLFLNKILLQWCTFHWDYRIQVDIFMKRIYVFKEDMGFTIYAKHVCFQVLG